MNWVRVENGRIASRKPPRCFIVDGATVPATPELLAGAGWSRFEAAAAGEPPPGTRWEWDGESVETGGDGVSRPRLAAVPVAKAARRWSRLTVKAALEKVGAWEAAKELVGPDMVETFTLCDWISEDDPRFEAAVQIAVQQFGEGRVREIVDNMPAED